MRYLILAPIILLSGCALFQSTPPVEKVVYVNTPLTIPPRPILPTFTYSDIQCVNEDVIKKIADRDLIRKQYSEQLEAIINSTNSK